MGNETFPYASTSMEDVIKEAYYKPDSGYRATCEIYKDDESLEDELLTFDEFAEIMRRGFGSFDFDPFALIRLDYNHIQFEPFEVEI